MDDSREAFVSRRGIFDVLPLDLLDSEGCSDFWRSLRSFPFPLPLGSEEAGLLALELMRFMADLTNLEPLNSGFFVPIERVIGENPWRNDALSFLFGRRAVLGALGELSSSSVSSSKSSSCGICTRGAGFGLTIRIEGSPSTDMSEAVDLAPLVGGEVTGLVVELVEL